MVLSIEFISCQCFSAVIMENPEAYCIFDYLALTVQWSWTQNSCM